MQREPDEERIFHFARKLAAEDRRDYLEQVCSADGALRLEQLVEAAEAENRVLSSKDSLQSTESASHLPKSAGETIGRYKLLQKIGEGGFGVVYMAEQMRPVRRKVALKVIKPGMDSDAVVARFEAERQALAMMDHPNIARVFDGGATDQGRPYFVMELVKGVPLTEYCDANTLPTKERLELFATVCGAVQHAHLKGIIHRDLKPSNILVTLHDGTPVVKVIDFGVSKALNQQLTEKTLFTAFGQMIGTPQYMSPEQAEISGLDVDTRSDVYSLGVILYELLTGSTPLESQRLRTAGYAEMQRLIKEEEPPSPSSRLSTCGKQLTIIAKHRSVSPDRLAKQVKGDLDWIVLKALEKDRGRRFETASGMSADIQRYLADEPVEARPPSSVLRIKKMLWRNRALVASLAGISCALTVGLVLALFALLDSLAQSERNQKLVFDLRETLFDQGLSEALAGNFNKSELVSSRLESIEGAETLSLLLKSFQHIVAEEHGKAIELLEPYVNSRPRHCAARGLLTYAYEGGGDLNSFFESHNILVDLEAVTAEDFFFKSLGYGIEPKEGVRLVDEALKIRKSPVAYLFRGRMRSDWAVQSGRTGLIELSVADVDLARAWLGNSGSIGIQLLRTHVCNMHAALAASDTLAYAKARNAAREIVDALEKERQTSGWKSFFLGLFYYKDGDPKNAFRHFEDASLMGYDFATTFYLAVAFELGIKPNASLVESEISSPYGDLGRAQYWAANANQLKSLKYAQRAIDNYQDHPDVYLGGLYHFIWFGEFETVKRLAEKYRERRGGAYKAEWLDWEIQHVVEFMLDGNERGFLDAATNEEYQKRWKAYAYSYIAAFQIGNGDWEAARANIALCADQQIPYFTDNQWCQAFLKRKPILNTPK